MLRTSAIAGVVVLAMASLTAWALVSADQARKAAGCPAKGDRLEAGPDKAKKAENNATQKSYWRTGTRSRRRRRRRLPGSRRFSPGRQPPI